MEDNLNLEYFQLRELLDKMHLSVAVYQSKNNGEDFIFTDINEAGEKFSRVSREEIIGKSVLRIFPKVKDFGLFKVFQEVWRTGNPQSFPISLYQDERISQWVENYVYRLSSNEIVAVYNDLTESKLSEEHLRFTNMVLESQNEASTEGILVVNDKGKIVSHNKRFIEIWEIPPEIVESRSDELTLKSVLDKLVDPKGFLSRVNFLYKNREKKSQEEVSLKNGKILNCYSSPLTGRDGQYYGRVWFFRDITERKQIEKALIENERLSAISELSAGVAHDFNNSLQVILGNTEMALLTPETPPEVINNLESIKKSTVDAASRIRQLKRFTQKKTSANFLPLDLNTLLEEVVLQARPLWKDEAEKEGLRISFKKFYGKINSIIGEEGEIRSVLLNLLKNAVESMEKSGTITIATWNSEDKVCISIEDEGIGMDEKTKKRIFDPFFSTKGLEPGRGLGMSSVYYIVRDHNGKILIDKTSLGKGTKIKLTFPSVITKVPLSKEDSWGNCQINGKVLWVDDEELVRDIAGLFMKELGIDFNIADSGETGLAFLSENQYDLLITDIGMPEMNGWELAKIAHEKYPGMKIAVATGWGTDIVSAEQKQSGIGYILGKPVSFKEIRNLIREALQSKS